MGTILLAAGTALAYLIAYNTYGKFLAKKIFSLDKAAKTPAYELEDNVDYVPTKKEILFGHHYTSIAGTGPIVGPALGIIWGWVPALLWVLLGSIFMGAVHDFGALVLSMRHKGKSIGDVAANLISKRVRIMFLAIIFLVLMIVIAVFCLVIAKLFDLYPQSILSIWFEIPLAVWLGYMIYVKKKHALIYSIIALVLLYVSVLVGAYSTGVVSSQELTEIVKREFDLRPAAIIERLNLLRPIFRNTCNYGHFGRENPDFTWEKTDMVGTLKKAVK